MKNLIILSLFMLFSFDSFSQKPSNDCETFIFKSNSQEIQVCEVPAVREPIWTSSGCQSRSCMAYEAYELKENLDYPDIEEDLGVIGCELLGGTIHPVIDKLPPHDELLLCGFRDNSFIFHFYLGPELK